MKLSTIIQLALLGVITWTLTACGSSKARATHNPEPSLPPVMSLPSEAAAEQETIRFLEDKVRRDPEDFIAHNKLAGLYLQRVRETGDVSYLNLAAKAAHASVTTLPVEQNSGGLTALAQVEYSSHEFT